MYDPRDLSDRDTSSIMWVAHHAGPGLLLLPFSAATLAWILASQELGWEPDAWLWVLAGLVGIVTAVFEVLVLFWLWEWRFGRRKKTLST